MSEDPETASSSAPLERPPWIRVRVPTHPDKRVGVCLDDLHLHTVCRSAKCPNQLECYQKGRATFLLMGPSCTRHCGFCAVDRSPPAPLDATEPARVAEAVARLELHHAVITSVTRDDLCDGGADHFAAVVAAIRKAAPETTIEILVPDFDGDEDAWAVAAASEPDVFNHNIETVPRLYETVRPGADYDRSLALLDFVSERYPKMKTKSGVMLGLGEEWDEVLEVAEDMRGVGVSMITVGQYLQPDQSKNLQVQHYWTPEEFGALRAALVAMNFSFVACAPLVRSSYDALEALDAARGG